MSRLSDTGLILCTVGTAMSVASFLISIIISPFMLYIQVISGIVFVIALIILGITRNEYRIIKTKSGFSLKIDHLIMFICAMSVTLSFCLWIDINHYTFTGEISYFTIVPIIYLLFMSVFLSIRKVRYHPQSVDKDILGR